MAAICLLVFNESIAPWRGELTAVPVNRTAVLQSVSLSCKSSAELAMGPPGRLSEGALVAAIRQQIFASRIAPQDPSDRPFSN